MSTVLRKVSGAGFGTTELGPPWTTPSLLNCAARCLSRYLQDCKSIIFDRTSLLCTPGGAIFTTLSGPSSGELFTTNADCRTSKGLIVTLFELLIYGQSATCQSLQPILQAEDPRGDHQELGEEPGETT
ncbi:hypothetical protein RRG08_039236 [Elysia crispata]|uniref:Uncharacterized protein n=1 Tax=Elysia crispata TaxID=231223 RepID=A0AAE1EF39_9GAST|nr:hypothetical protein RRG08_039236 [Elysia crispata]